MASFVGSTPREYSTGLRRRLGRIEPVFEPQAT
jgi:hypothetical protein